MKVKESTQDCHEKLWKIALDIALKVFSKKALELVCF
jgi:hypothetical protein